VCRRWRSARSARRWRCGAPARRLERITASIRPEDSLLWPAESRIHVVEQSGWRLKKPLASWRRRVCFTDGERASRPRGWGGVLHSSPRALDIVERDWLTSAPTAWIVARKPRRAGPPIRWESLRRRLRGCPRPTTAGGRSAGHGMAAEVHAAHDAPPRSLEGPRRERTRSAVIAAGTPRVHRLHGHAGARSPGSRGPFGRRMKRGGPRPGARPRAIAASAPVAVHDVTTRREDARQL